MSKSGTEPELDLEDARLDSRLQTIGAQQKNILSALSMVLDILRAQGKMLQQLTALAREEPASSPLLESIDDLTNAIGATDGSLQTMAGQIGELPQAIVMEFSRQGDGATVPGG